MTAKTQSPSDAELRSLASQHMQSSTEPTRYFLNSAAFARAVLARWGAAAAVGEPVARVYTMEALVPGGSIKHHVELLKPLPAGTTLYTAPPTQPAERMPLTKPQRDRLFNNRHLANQKNMGVNLTMAEWHQIVQYIEAAHGITTQGDSNAD